MKKTLSIVGARPQFIKAFITIKSLNTHKSLKNILLHTGQHFDKEMSGIFFKELNFHKNLIKINLSKKNDRISRISEMLFKINNLVKKISPDLIIVYGDTDSTLVGSIIAKRLKIKLMHIEAGLRSNIIDMPEEQNRYIADYLSNYLIAPTRFAKKNIKYLLNKRKIYNFGDVMFDSIIFYKNQIDKKYTNNFNKKNNLKEKYIFLSIHRDSNSNFYLIKKYLKQISKIKKIFFWPVHPKIQKIIKNYKLKIPNNLIYAKPISYMDTITAILNSEFVVTDSGGIQKESYFLNKKCFLLREETEWQELISLNSLKLIGNNFYKIQESNNFLNKKIKKSNLYGDGTATKKIAILVKKILKNS